MVAVGQEADPLGNQRMVQLLDNGQPRVSVARQNLLHQKKKEPPVNISSVAPARLPPSGNSICSLNYLVGIGVLVRHPATQAVAPIFNYEGFGKLLSLSVTEPPLGFTGRHEEWPVTGQGHFQPLADVVLDSRTRTPGSASFLDSNSAQITTLLITISVDSSLVK